MFRLFKNAIVAFLTILFCLISKPLLGQLYGNEWIDTTKVHVKFPIGKEGVYRIGYFALDQFFTDANVFLNKIPFNQFRMFNMGKQVPMYVVDQNNNNYFDFFDYVEFVGHTQDGSFDNELFNNPKSQRHKLSSFVTDTAYYFFTYRNSGSPLRFSNYTNSSPPSTSPRAYHEFEVRYAPNINYSNGDWVLVGDKIVFSPELTNGEGFCGDFFYGSEDPTAINYSVKIPTPGLYAAGSTPWIESGVVGISILYTGSANHHLNYLIGPSVSTYRSIKDTIFRATEPVTFKSNLKASDIGKDYTYLLFNSTYVTIQNGSTVAHSHTILHYPKVYDFADSIRYSYTEDSSKNPENIEWNNYGDGFFSIPLIFDETNLNRKGLGQIFTPWHICTFMAHAAIEVAHEAPKNADRPLRILDPCCGSGRMLLCASRVAGAQEEYFGIDIDHTCAKMTALNLFLSGLFHTETMHGDALAMDDFRMGYKTSIIPFGIFRIEDKTQSQLWHLLQNCLASKEKIRLPPLDLNPNSYPVGPQMTIF